MNSIKCNACGLTNLVTDICCRRCEQNLDANPGPGPAAAYSSPRPEKRFSFFPYLLILLGVGFVSFIVFGVHRSVTDVKARDDNRIATKAKEEADSIQSGKDRDAELNDKMKKIAANLPSLDTGKQMQDTQRAIQPSLDKMQKENDRLRQVAAESAAARQNSVPPSQ